MVWSNQASDQIVIEGSSAGLFVYNATPGPGTLFISLTAQAGIDPYGNAYNAGLTFNAGPPSFALYTIQADSTGPGATELRIDGGPVFLSGGIQVGAGEPGMYYYEKRTLSGLAVASGVGVTLVPGAVQTLRTNYGTGWAGNTWTAPVDGEYDWTLALGGIGACTRCFARVNVNGAANPSLWDDTAITGTGKQISGTLEMVAGDTAQVSAFQNTGAGINLSALSFVSVGRRL
jgi:hypothetical protein